MPARLIDAGFPQLTSLLEEEKLIAKEFLRATGAIHDFLCAEEVEHVEAMLDERQLYMDRAEEVRSQVDLLYLSFRGSLSDNGLIAFSALKEEIAALWQEARERDKLVADKMHALLVDLRHKLKEVDRSKRGSRAYAETEKHLPRETVDEKQSERNGKL